MKKFFAIFFAIILIAAGYLYFTYFKTGKKTPKGPKPVAMTVSAHSEAFNNSINEALQRYYALSEAFVNWNEAEVKQYSLSLSQALDSVQLDELKVDTTGIYESALDPVSNAKAEASTILVADNWEAKRVSFKNLSENLRLLLIIVQYDLSKIYWQECPMAFNDSESANWLSKSEEVRNPYLGTSHPKYKGTMLACGAPKETIDFVKTPPAK